MNVSSNNPNFNHMYLDQNQIDLSKCIKVNAIIEMINYNRQDLEDFWATSLDNAEKEIKEVIDYFNSTLREGESPRKFIRLEDIK